MSEVYNNYLEWADKRRKELNNIIFERTQGSVVRGPFQAMKILPKWEWGDSDYASKVLGIYECELYERIEQTINNHHDLIMNIGCAEGFYGVGFGLRTDAQIVMVDPFQAVLNIARENAQVNSVNKIHFLQESNPDIFRSYLQKYKNPFIFMDCEGAEDQFLDLDQIPELEKTSIIVESHDCVIPGLTNKLKERFKDTHWIEEIRQGAKDPHVWIIDDLGDYDKYLICSESRPSTMTWLEMIPKH